MIHHQLRHHMQILPRYIEPASEKVQLFNNHSSILSSWARLMSRKLNHLSRSEFGVLTRAQGQNWSEVFKRNETNSETSVDLVKHCTAVYRAQWARRRWKHIAVNWSADWRLARTGSKCFLNIRFFRYFYFINLARGARSRGGPAQSQSSGGAVQLCYSTVQ